MIRSIRKKKQMSDIKPLTYEIGLPIYGGARGSRKPINERKAISIFDHVVPERRFTNRKDQFVYMLIMYGQGKIYETEDDAKKERQRLKITPAEVRQQFRAACYRYLIREGA